MSNLAVYKKGSNEIRYFLRDCVKDGNDLLGSNKKVFGIKSRHWDLLWTEDDVLEIRNDEGRIIAYNKSVSELIPIVDASLCAEVQNTEHAEYAQALRIRKLIESLSYNELETYIQDNVTDLASAKQYLIKLSKVVLALGKVVNRRLKT